MAGAARSKYVGTLIARAEEMRRHPTPAESRALQLFSKEFGRESFRHQRVISKFIVDFLFPDEKLVVEVDGSVHDGFVAGFRDRSRDARIRDRGYYVLRVTNDQIFREPQRVIAEIAERRRRRSGFFGRVFNGRKRL